MQGIDISKELSHRPDVAVGYLLLADFHANRDQEKLPKQYLEKSLALFEEMEMPYWRGEAHKIVEKMGIVAVKKNSGDTLALPLCIASLLGIPVQDKLGDTK